VTAKIFAAVDAAAPYLWTGAAALICSLFLNITWWHPYCDHQSDGPGSFAFGFPLPYGAPTGVSSMEFFYMPHVLLLNLVFFAAVTYPLSRAYFRRAAAGSRRLRIASSTGLLLFALVGAFEALFFSDVGQPIGSISSVYYESYWSYRPYVLMAASVHKECFYR